MVAFSLMDWCLFRVSWWTMSGFPRQVQDLWGPLSIGLVRVFSEADSPWIKVWLFFIREDTCERTQEEARKVWEGLRVQFNFESSQRTKESKRGTSILDCHTVWDRLNKVFRQQLNQVFCQSAAWHDVIGLEKLWEAWPPFKQGNGVQSLAMAPWKIMLPVGECQTTRAMVEFGVR